MGIDILVYNPQEFEALCRTRRFFREEILGKGRLIYERGELKTRFIFLHKALKEVIETDFDSSKVEIAVIKKETRKFEKLSNQKLEGYINNI